VHVCCVRVLDCCVAAAGRHCVAVAMLTARVVSSLQARAFATEQAPGPSASIWTHQLLRLGVG
jgi:hypothetical protein